MCVGGGGGSTRDPSHSVRGYGGALSGPAALQLSQFLSHKT